MTSDKTIELIEKWTWILIYAGLFAIIVGIASMSASPSTAWTLVAVGAVLAVAGVVLIWVRSKLDARR
ncbi:hypothetical protein [Caenimonas koreensis]|uniref:Uncharacterized protein n=1 Tax=Caenimonas koreensis DSM 17982 TaxID=1121255 RepID=A0A844BAR5_9BURK|nr:hypothetical protein [Caenimonas koreensis]MRD48547.1 hypothetical protein [Caenimonas koreensis DSM 17982]